jgi:type II secretory pathway pseudopilin PulG
MSPFLLPRSHRSRRAFTMVELMVAVPITFLFLLLITAVLATSGVILKNITEETRFREGASVAMGRIEQQMRQSSLIELATSYTVAKSATTYNGSCVYITNPSNPTGPNLAFYYYKAPAWDYGRLYLDTDTSTAPDPDDDEVIATRITSFEVRRNPTGTGSEYRLALRGDVKGTKFLGIGNAEGNRVILATTVRPRRK